MTVMLIMLLNILNSFVVFSNNFFTSSNCFLVFLRVVVVQPVVSHKASNLIFSLLRLRKIARVAARCEFAARLFALEQKQRFVSFL